MWKKLLIIALIANISMTAASCVTAADNKAQKEEEEPADTYEMLNMLGEIMERTKVSYVEEVSDKKLIESAINGMLSSLDPHSSFLDAKSFQYLNEQTQGKFGGLGLEVTMENGVVKVVSPIDDTPAFKAGLKPGDYIISLDGTTVVGMSLNEAVDKMRGKAGTKIKLTIRRGVEKPFDVTLKREEIKIRSVKSDIKSKDVAYIRISSFSEGIDKNIKEALEKIRKENKEPIKGVVIDVRNNPGGLLDQAVSVSDIFLQKGVIVSIKGRRDNTDRVYEAKKQSDDVRVPMVVLINAGSASASEIVAGALRDQKRALILGERSFGKGSVQNIIPLSDGSGLKLTVALYYTPNGSSIQAEGIVPDLEVVFEPPRNEDKDNPRFLLREQDLNRHLENGKDKKGSQSKAKKDEGKEQLARDNQLRMALQVVKSLPRLREIQH